MDPVVWWDIQKELVTYLAKKKKCSLVSSEDVKISHFLVHSRFFRVWSLTSELRKS